MSAYRVRPRSSRVTKCSICSEETRDVKCLPCDHKFCQKCVNHHISRISSALGAHQQVNIVCPYCRDFFLSTVDFLQDESKCSTSVKKDDKNIDHSLLRSTSHMTGNTKRSLLEGRCQPCAEGKEYMAATCWCQDCSEYLCSTCARFHKSMKMSKLHVVKTLRDKERYENVKPKALEAAKSFRDTGKDLKSKVTNNEHRCEPCRQSRKIKEAKYLCDNCNEKLCDDCSQCHRSMKMSKTHKMILMKDVLEKSETNFSVGLKCERHYGEVLSLFCKRCRSSCCAICAITLHSNCGSTTKLDASKSIGAPSTIKAWSTKEVGKQADKSLFNGLHKENDIVGNGKLVSFGAKSGAKAAETQQKVAKCSIPKNRMENRKTRISIRSDTKGDWVISMAVLTSGDILLTELYQPTLKMIDSNGSLISTCSFFGDPWSVAVYNDSLAAVTFSDRKQIQLINITRDGLKTGKKLGTRHKSLAVCFAKDLIVTTCWEGCVHVMNVTGREICSIDKDSYGDRLFTNPEYIAADKIGTTVYVSDYKRNTITALKLLPTRIDSKPVFVFSDKELEGPKGITVDRTGVVYISGMSSRNIFRISPSGQKIQVYRRREDLDYYEAIAVSLSGDKLFVTAYEDSTIIVFRFTK